MTVSDEYRKQLLSGLTGSGSELTNGQKEISDLAGSESQIEGLISILRDPSSSTQAKKSALNQLNVISVFSPVLPRKMADYINALRGLLDDDDDDVRISAYGTLAANKDEVAQERLQSELQSDKPESERIVPTHQAIGMLGFDDKALDYGVLRTIVENPPSAESIVAAVRHLPADIDSYDVLKRLMEDDSQPLEARSLVPDMINNVRPLDFLASVESLLRAKGSQYDLAPYLARGVGGINSQPPGLGLPTLAAPSAESNVLSAEIEKAKSLFRELLPDSPEPLQKATDKYLFSD